ncbi:sugar ABC transporter substrate-binding protein, partial [Pseudomonas syringae]|nr:sugar ABC transporter substrate-binding protein [Pseudomonas syringae]
AKEVKWGDGTDKNYILPWVPVTDANADALYKQVSGGK